MNGEAENEKRGHKQAFYIQEAKKRKTITFCYTSIFFPLHSVFYLSFSRTLFLAAEVRRSFLLAIFPFSFLVET